MLELTTTEKRFLLVLLFCVLSTSAAAQNDSTHTKGPLLTEPYSLHDDFQGDGLAQWASYPPAQDVGYEPSLSPTSEYGAPGGRSLMRVIKPNRAGALRFGFIKKLRLSVGNDSRLRFSYRLNSPTPDATIGIGLAGADGRLYSSEITAKINEWTTADLAFNQIRNPVAGTGIEAVYVIALIRQADADVTYRFIIDDVTISAAHEVRFDVKNPNSEIIEPWPALISAKSYGVDETIAVEASAPVQVVQADCSLQTPDGRVVTSERLYDDGSHGDRKAGDGLWSNNALYTFRSSDPKGVWLAQLRGTTKERQAINTFVRVIVRPQATGSHPRLFFSAVVRQKLIERSRNPKLSSLWMYLLTTAKSARESGEIAQGGDVFELLDTEYLLPSLLAYFDVLNRARSRIAHNAFEAYITGNEEARKSAKSALLDVARWKHWEPPWFRAHGQHTYYPAGMLAADAALGYDLLYDDLSEPERAMVRRALIEKSIVPTFKEYVADNRVMANTSNWIAHTVGGALIAAACIANDLRDGETDRRFEIYVGGLMRKLEDHMKASFLADGSYGEGISYQEFDLETLSPALVAVRRAFGSDYFKQTRVMDSLTYPLYTLVQPASASLDMGDTHPPAGHGIPALVYQSKDPVVRWYYSQFDRPSLSKFIFYDDSAAPQPPTLPTSRIFAQKGNAVLRSGWGKDDLIFLYRAGPTFNHNHADQGSFLLSAYGESLVTEAGWSDYYKDPYYVTYFTQAAGHNTVLVDGNPESQSIADTPQFAALNNYPKITDAVTSDFFDSLSSELASVYQGRLQHFTRRIVFLKPHYLVIFDDLLVQGPAAKFDWLLHLPDLKAIKNNAGLAIYEGKQAALAVRAFAPDQCNMSVRPGHVPYQEFASRTPAAVPAQPAYLDLSTGLVEATNFLIALVPSKNAEAARALAANMSQIKDNTWLGIRTRRDKETDLVMFRLARSAAEAPYGEWLTDAAAWTVTESAGRPLILSAQTARSFSRSGRLLFASDRAASFAVQFESNSVRAKVYVSQPAQVRFNTGTAPAKVRLDGNELPASAVRYSAAEQTTQTSITAGQHELVFSLQ